jgi:hypothetical protein
MLFLRLRVLEENQAVLLIGLPPTEGPGLHEQMRQEIQTVPVVIARIRLILQEMELLPQADGLSFAGFTLGGWSRGRASGKPAAVVLPCPGLGLALETVILALDRLVLTLCQS